MFSCSFSLIRIVFMCVFLWFILSFFLIVCLSVTVKWLAVKTASEMTYTVSGGALNSAQSNPIQKHWSPIQGPQPDTSSSCKTTDICRVVCLFTSQLLPVLPIYTAGYQRPMGVNNLPRVVTWQPLGWKYKRFCHVQCGKCNVSAILLNP